MVGEKTSLLIIMPGHSNYKCIYNIAFNIITCACDYIKNVTKQFSPPCVNYVIRYPFLQRIFLDFKDPIEDGKSAISVISVCYDGIVDVYDEVSTIDLLLKLIKVWYLITSGDCPAANSSRIIDQLRPRGAGSGRLEAREPLRRRSPRGTCSFLVPRTSMPDSSFVIVHRITIVQ